MSSTVLTADDARSTLERRGRVLEYFTIGWNSIEAVLSITIGVLAGSVALTGFGIDSVIEGLSGAILLWRLFAGEKREQIALRLVGGSLLLLAAYVGVDAIQSLIFRETPEITVAGIIIAAVSLVVMPILGREKRKVAQQLNSRALEVDSKQTDLCAFLSAILLGGLILNAAFGWWWADAVAALLMTPIIIKEGIAAVRGEHCGCNANHCH